MIIGGDGLRVPGGWSAVSDADLEAFVDHVAMALRAMAKAPTTDKPAASPSLAALAHRWTISGDLSPADLLLLTSAGIHVPFDAANRLLASDSWHRTAVLRAAAEVDDGISLVMAGPHDLVRMERLHAMLDAALSGSGLAEITRDQMAVFLCARLRPKLFPPSTLFAPPRTHGDRWQLYRAALDHPRVRVELLDAWCTCPELQSMEDLAVMELAFGYLSVRLVDAVSGSCSGRAVR